MLDPQATFRRELAHLRGKTIDAITQGRTDEVERSLMVYERLIEEVLSEYQRLTTAAPPPIEAMWRGEFGTEWRWLQQDVYGFVAAAFESRRAGSVREIINFTFRLCMTADDREQAAALRAFLDILTVIWVRAVQTPLAAERPVDQLLVILQNLAEFKIARAGTSNPGWSTTACRLVLRACSTMLRDAANENDSVSFGQLIEQVETLWEFSTLPDEESIQELKGVMAYGGAAWVLLHEERDHHYGDPGDYVGGYLRLIPQDRTWQCFSAALSEDASDFFGWHSWELELRARGRAIIISFDTFIERVAVIALVTRRVPVPSRPDERTAELARRLLERRSEIESTFALAELPQPGPALVDDFLTSLGRAREAYETEYKATLASTPLDPARLSQFRLGFARAVKQTNRLLALFHSADAYNHVVERAVGFNTLVPREYFVTTRVIAEPDRLGEQFGEGLVRGENLFLLEQLRAEAREAESTVARVRADVGTFVNFHHDFLVIVLNSIQIAEELGLPGARGSGSLPGTNVPVHVIYTEEQLNACFVVDRRFCALSQLDPAGDWSDPGQFPRIEIDDWTDEAGESRVRIRIRETIGWSRTETYAPLLVRVSDADW